MSALDETIVIPPEEISFSKRGRKLRKRKIIEDTPEEQDNDKVKATPARPKSAKVTGQSQPQGQSKENPNSGSSRVSTETSSRPKTVLILPRAPPSPPITETPATATTNRATITSLTAQKRNEVESQRITTSKETTTSSTVGKNSSGSNNAIRTASTATTTNIIPSTTSSSTPSQKNSQSQIQSQGQGSMPINPSKENASRTSPALSAPTKNISSGLNTFRVPLTAVAIRTSSQINKENSRDNASSSTTTRDEPELNFAQPELHANNFQITQSEIEPLPMTNFPNSRQNVNDYQHRSIVFTDGLPWAIINESKKFTEMNKLVWNFDEVFRILRRKPQQDWISVDLKVEFPEVSTGIKHICTNTSWKIRLVKKADTNSFSIILKLQKRLHNDNIPVWIMLEKCFLINSHKEILRVKNNDPDQVIQFVAGVTECEIKEVFTLADVFVEARNLTGLRVYLFLRILNTWDANAAKSFETQLNEEVARNRIAISAETFYQNHPILKNFKDLYFSTTFSDFSLKIREKYIPVHSFILSGCSIFTEKLEIARNTNKSIIDMDNVNLDYDTVILILKFLYKGKVEIEQANMNLNTLEIFKKACKDFKLEDLKRAFIAYLMKNVLTMENPHTTRIMHAMKSWELSDYNKMQLERIAYDVVINQTKNFVDELPSVWNIDMSIEPYIF